MVRQLEVRPGIIALVDDQDWPEVSARKWHIVPSDQSDEKYYVRSGAVYLHRLIMKPPKGMEVDHIDRNPLNNTRANLRVATRSQNCANGRMRRGGSNRFKGVYWRGDRGCYHVKISVRGRMVHLGSFRDEIEAAAVYDSAARRHFGPFANLNFPPAPATPPEAA